MDEQQQIEALVTTMTVDRYAQFEKLVEQSAQGIAGSVVRFIQHELTAYTDTFTAELEAQMRTILAQQLQDTDQHLIDEAARQSSRFYAAHIRAAALRSIGAQLLAAADPIEQSS